MPLIHIDWKPSPRQLRTFGLICSAACVIFSGWLLWRHSVVGISLSPDAAARVGYWLWGIAALAGLSSLAAPRLLWPFYVLLTAISLPIGIIVSHLVIAALFYLVLTPYALIFRLFGRDPLNRHLDRSCRSYWTARQRMQSMERYYRQF